MKRIVIFKNGTDTDGKVIMLTHSMSELLDTASKKFNFLVNRIFTIEGGEIDEIDLIRDNDVLYVSGGESFIRRENRVMCSNYSQSPCVMEGDWITLNVGGKYFVTTRNTLVMKEPDSILAKMFLGGDHGLMPSKKDSNGAYLIDRSPFYFEPILNYLRTSKIIIDQNLNPNGLLEEARYFGLEYMISELEKIVMYYQHNKDKVPLTRRDVINVLISTRKSTELRFQGVNLAGADLSKLDLSNINFKYANLRRCLLTGANLTKCCMEKADLTEAILDGAQLGGVKMLRAILENASLKGCNFELCGTNANMEGVNLKGANLEESNMVRVQLRVATLKNACMKYCDLTAAVLAGADLENCDLSGSNLHETNLRGANLKGASLELMQTPVHMSQTVN